MDRHRRPHHIAVLFLAAAAVVGVTAPVAADTPVSHSGTVGVHYLADSKEYPGARCKYDGSSNLATIRVRDPFVFASSNDPDSLSVAWQVIVQKRAGSGPWTTVKKSPRQFGEATTGTPADFSPISVAITADTSADYHVLVRMTWYVGGKALAQVGTATHRVDRYHYPLAAANKGFCPSFIL